MSDTAATQAKGYDATSVVRLAELEAILRTAVNAIVTIDSGGTIESANPATTQLFGYAADQLVGSNVTILMPAPHAAAHDGYLANYLRTGSRKIIGIGREVTGRRIDGSTFPIHLAVSEFEANGQRYFAGVITDLTEQKRVEQELRDSNLRFLTAFNSAAAGIGEVDRAGRFTRVNKRYCELVGYSQAEILALSPRELTHPDDRDSSWSDFQLMMNGQEPGYATEKRYVRKDGSIVWVSVTASPITDAAGNVVASIGIAIDITATKAAERALKESERRLAQAQKMEALGQLAGGIAHDFNNLLTVITGNQELLEMRLQDQRDLALLKRAQDAAEMGARLTGRMLTFARRRQLEPAVLDLNEQIIAMVELLRRSIGEQVSLTTNLAPRLWKVRVDPGEIENTTLNLAINARDAMPNGGALVIETADRSVEEGEIGGESKLPAGDYVRLTVSDTGTGMTPEVLSRAFEPFFTTKPPGKGTGLGLSTIYGFVQQSGGAVTVYSEVGHGTTVNIYLPREVDAAGSERQRHQSTAPDKANGEVVLLVEDNTEVRAVTLARLEQLGYRIVEAETGQVAIEKLQAAGSGIQIVFSDVVMPGGISGYDVARWVARHAPTVKVLLTSGYPGDVASARQGEAKAGKLLRKPYSRAELARALRGALDQ